MTALRCLTRMAPATIVALLGLTLTGTPVSAQFPPASFENLRVLPKDIATNDLVSMMAGFTRALGVRCTYCHVGEESIPLAEYDFVSDEKLAKRKARVMIEMVGRINDTHLASLEDRAEPSVSVTCITCHRGTRQPRMLQDVIVQAYDTGGADSAIATYRSLRERFYGRFIYDFGEVPLTDAAGMIVQRGSIGDAVRLLELNVEMNPTSTFARTQYINMALGEAFVERSVSAGMELYGELRERFGSAAFSEPQMNALGYSVMRRGAVDPAIAIFQLNAEAYPESANVHDSLGEAYMVKGDVAAAIRSYERSLELDPGNANARDRLRELRGRSAAR